MALFCHCTIYGMNSTSLPVDNQTVVRDDSVCVSVVSVHHDTERRSSLMSTSRLSTVQPTKQESRDAMARVLMLGSTLFFIIGGYWVVRSLKLVIFSELVGLDYLPTAKLFSLVVMLMVIFAYNYLVELVPHHYLFYILGTFYGSCFFTIAGLLAHPTIGLDNTDIGTHRLLGWIAFFCIETYSSITIALFWSFVTTVYSFDGARKSYGYIVAGSQLGSIFGPVIVRNVRLFGGIPNVFAIGACCPVLSMVMIYYYMRKFGSSDAENREATTGTSKKKSGVLEGLRLLLKYPYVAGIFIVSNLCEIAFVIMDYELLRLGKDSYPNKNDFTEFMGDFGIAVNALSFFISVVGTTTIFKRFQLRSVLAFIPVLMFLDVMMIYYFQSLWVVYAGVVFFKSLLYAVNNPAKELLYSVTSPDVKFKAKSWIDAFGSRSMKAVGSCVTGPLVNNMNKLFAYGSIVSSGVCFILVVVGWTMGSHCEKYVKEHHIVGERKKIDDSLDIKREPFMSS